MGLLIDTSIIIQIERSGTDPTQSLTDQGNQSPFLSAISASELLHGLHRAPEGRRRERRRQFIDAVFEALPILDFDLESARVHARIWADLQSRGMIIGSHDLLIAATALRHQHALLTANEREFRRVEGLQVHTAE